jgi:hypothetical protein
MKKPFVGLFLAVFLVALEASTVLAASKTWAGTGPGSRNWSVANNWVGGTAPQSGDDLTFPPPGATLTTKTNNDFQPITAFNTLTLDGNYSITGNGFQLNGVNPGVALTVGQGQKPVISTGAIFMHTGGPNATSQISLGAGSLLDMRGTSQLKVGDAPPNVTSLLLTGGTGSKFLGPGSLDVDTLHLAGSATFVPQLVSQNANTPGTVLTDPGTLIATTQTAGATVTSSSSITINGDLLEAVSAPSTGGLDFIGPTTFGSTSNVSWEAFNSNVDNVINFNQGVNLSPAKFHIQLPAGFQPYAPNAVYPVITSQGPAFSQATEFSNMKDGETQTVAGYTFKAQYNVPDPGDFRIVTTGSPAGAPAPPATGRGAFVPGGPSQPGRALLALAALLLATGTATVCWRRFSRGSRRVQRTG